MSLFPAYNENVSSAEQPKRDENYEAKSWLANSSFIPFLTEPNKSIDVEVSSQRSASLSESDDSPAQNEEHASRKSKKHKKEKKKRKKQKLYKEIEEKPIEFTGEEEFYVDKEPIRGYLSVKTLYRPACPRYRKTFKQLGSSNKSSKHKRNRYFATKYWGTESQQSSTRIPIIDVLPEDEFAAKNKEFNRTLAHNQRNIDVWIEYVHHQERIPMRTIKTQMAERKLDIIEKALVHNLGDERLYRLYVDILDSTYPSFEVSKFLDRLLEKDPTNYILWNAQIQATQGSMARCVVPDVLKLYEECMQKMYRKSQDDEVMLKLFNSCALFLRQSGLNEQFFALIKLALELNVSVDKFNSIEPDEKDQQTLIEYEELILKSGLPMNEIWLRIEKLRQNYNFLPCPSSRTCSDPQRIVFNEDICYFIFPLVNKENCFALIIIILRLLKIPFLSTSSLRNRFLFNETQNLNEFDAIEDVLAVCLHQTTSLFVNSLNFDLTLYELVKEMISGPSFLSVNIGHEIYLETVLDILTLCSECYQSDERKRTIFVLLWLKFERILLIIEKIAKKLSNERMKKIKAKVKNVLKKEENRNVLNFYTEYALIECELENLHVAENILVTSISGGGSDVAKSDFCHAHVTYAEILIKNQNNVKALKVLTCFALDISLEELEGEVLSEPRKLLALKKITERLSDLVFIEKHVQIMEIEQYFLPDYLISLIKAKVYFQIILKSKLEAMASLDHLLRYFVEQNSRHTFVREQILEIYLKIMQYPDRNCYISNRLFHETLTRALNEFPENLFMLKLCATLDNHPWYKVRKLLTNTKSPLGIIFLIAAARHKYVMLQNSEGAGVFDQLSSNIDGNEMIYKRRVANILRESVEKSSNLRKNSIMWRLYLRSLCDIQATFEKSKNILLSGLDECPWHKALYLDGSVYVPQELAQIQDLMIEKQLRIYALPEELEILRNDTFEAPAIVN